MVGFFAVHFRLFTIIHGSFTFRLAGDAGVTGSAEGFALLLFALVASHGLSTAIHWFARGARHHVGPTQVMRQVYPRVVVMHLAVIGTGWLLVGGGAVASRLPWSALLRVSCSSPSRWLPMSWPTCTSTLST